MKKLVYFVPAPETAEDLKKAYKSLAKKYHPDTAGTDAARAAELNEIFKIINNEFDVLFDILKDVKRKKDGGTYTEWREEETESRTSAEMREILEKLIRMEGVLIEIVGSFIWCSGPRTIDYKDALLKPLGFKWSAGKSAWYLAPPGYVKRSKRKFDLNEIREMFGTEEVANDPYQKIN